MAKIDETKRKRFSSARTIISPPWKSLIHWMTANSGEHQFRRDKTQVMATAMFSIIERTERNTLIVLQELETKNEHFVHY